MSFFVPGQTLGPYQILALIGAGGMGEVYKATDTRLHRLVAIKVLGPSSLNSSKLRARVRDEARAIARLNHPHVCALFDIVEDRDHAYLVMEFLEGETLNHRLSRGQLPLSNLLKYGIEVAEALDAVHRNGLIHRDLKPANIMLTDVGAKLLDFGIAQLQEWNAGNALSLTTRTNELVDGQVVGTLAYMAPEQLEGRPCDARDRSLCPGHDAVRDGGRPTTPRSAVERGPHYIHPP